MRFLVLLLLPLCVDGQSAETFRTYNLQFASFFNDSSEFSNEWVNVESLLQTGMDGGKKKITDLPTTINFGFGFSSPLSWGKPLYNITVSSQGVCYVPGSSLINGLPTENYLAPLMGEYDLTRPDSEIAYVTNGSKFTVEWRNMVLQQQAEQGTFNFQLSINNDDNGTVWYLIKTIPVDFDAMAYRASGQSLIVLGTNIANRDPNTGEIVYESKSEFLEVQPESGVEMVWSVGGMVFTFDETTNTTETDETVANYTQNAIKSASQLQLGLFGPLLCLSSLLYLTVL